MMTDLRILTLLDWLENDLLLTVVNFQPASSDASFRRYFRVTIPEKTLIIMDAPPDKEKLDSFIKVAGLMTQAGIKVPTIHHQNKDDGFLLLDDFGEQIFLNLLTNETADDLYQQALDTLFKLQRYHPLLQAELPYYNEELLQRELNIFNEWFLQAWLGIDIPEDIWQGLQKLLINSALSQPFSCVHRDYHSRNLMLTPDNQLGVIDFQDAVIGPITYDVVSLLRDCYITWPEEKITGWLSTYQQKLFQAGLIDCDTEQFNRWFDLMGLQRHLKAIGIFSRLHLRDNKSGYLDDIPRTLNYVSQVCQNYLDLADFNDFLISQVQPAMAEQNRRQ